MPSTAVVILNYNGREYLEKFLPGVIVNSKGYDVVVADNCSTDNSIEFLETQPVQVIRMEQNLGYAGGYNKVLTQLEHDYLVLLNSDVEVTENWLDPLVSMMNHDERIGALQPKILDWNRKDYFEYAGAAGGFIDWLGYPFCRGRIFNLLEQDNGQYDDSREIFWASGACMMVRRTSLIDAGNLDPDFFAHMEEIDLCWRMQNKGYKILYTGQSTVFHVGGGTLSSLNPRKTFLNFRNGLYLLIKNKRVYQLLYTLPIRWILDVIASLKFLLSDGPGHAFAVIRAHFAVIRNLIKLLRKRKGKLNTRPSGVYWRSIVYARYIRGIRTFQELNQRL